MKPAEKLARAIAAAKKDESARSTSVAEWPETIVEAVIYHRLHIGMCARDALKSFRMLEDEFVDWNEVRVSTIKEIREQPPDGGASLDTAGVSKDFLEHVFRERQRIDLEYLDEATLTEARKFLRQIRGIDPATIEAILLKSRNHPVLPLNPELEALVTSSGLVAADETRDRKAKALFEKIADGDALGLHLFLLDVSRELGPREEHVLTGCKTVLKSTLAPLLKKSRSATAAKKSATPEPTADESS